MCANVVNQLEIFSKGECVACHEKNFVSDGKLPDFKGAIVGLNYDLACRISDHLLLTNQGFCFVEKLGVIVSRLDCQKVIDDFNTLK